MVAKMSAGIALFPRESAAASAASELRGIMVAPQEM